MIVSIVLLLQIISISSLIEDGESFLLGGELVGRQKKIRDRIVVVGTNEFPYMASLEYNRNHICGAVIIDKDFVLSAAHCVNNRLISKFTIRAGTFTLQDNVGINMQLREVKSMKIHGTYNKNGQEENDIVIFQLHSPFSIDEYVAPIKIPRSSDNVEPINKIVLFLGYGKKETGYLSKDLLKANFRILDKNNCPGIEKSLTTLCAIGETQKEAVCSGDSGGPLVVLNSKNPNDDMLVGLASFIIQSSSEADCDPRKPMYFTDIMSLKNWISRAKKLETQTNANNVLYE